MVLRFPGSASEISGSAAEISGSFQEMTHGWKLPEVWEVSWGAGPGPPPRTLSRREVGATGTSKKWHHRKPLVARTICGRNKLQEAEVADVHHVPYLCEDPQVHWARALIPMRNSDRVS